MLQHLSIKNYALIDQVEIDFQPGLNIITGETGAGKSIILGALSLILGQRAESKHFFSTKTKCIVEGHFDLRNYNLKNYFSQFDLDYEDTTILRREIHPEGRSRAFINDSPVTLNIMKLLAEQLVEIHSQHAALELGRESFQVSVLDSMAQNGKLLTKYKEVYQRLKNKERELEDLKENAVKAGADADYKTYLLAELQEAQLEEGEAETLEVEISRLTHAEDIKQSLNAAEHLLEGLDPSALSLLKQAIQFIHGIAEYDERIEEISNRLLSCHIELKDITSELTKIAQDTFIDQERIQLVRDRLDLIYKLQQKHQVNTSEELLLIQSDLKTELQARSDFDEKINALNRQVSSLKSEAGTLATQLHDSRKKVIPSLQEEVTTHLRTLGMPHAVFTIECSVPEENRLHSAGKDDVSFLFSANPGQSAGEIARVASGGELSRLMLTLKALVAARTALPCIIFDEIDTGISGNIALKVGESMENLARNMQVIAITHLPQIASMGNSHMKVSKSQRNKKSITQLKPLSANERLNEIAEMLGGTEIGETAIKHAKELLKR